MMSPSTVELQEELDAALDRFQLTMQSRFPNVYVEQTRLETKSEIAKTHIPDSDVRNDVTITDRINKANTVPQQPLDLGSQEQSTKQPKRHFATNLIQYPQRIYVAIKRWFSWLGSTHE
jgi:hypothetical protein